MSEINNTNNKSPRRPRKIIISEEQFQKLQEFEWNPFKKKKPVSPPGGENYPWPQPQQTGYNQKRMYANQEVMSGDTYLSYENFPQELYNLIKQKRHFFNIQFVKVDGTLRTSQFSTCSLNSRIVPDSTSPNGHWNRREKNILTFLDFAKTDPKTGKPGIISCRLKNIVYIKCGNKLFNFFFQNKIRERFPHLVKEEKSILAQALEEVLNEMKR